MFETYKAQNLRMVKAAAVLGVAGAGGEGAELNAEIKFVTVVIICAYLYTPTCAHLPRS